MVWILAVIALAVVLGGVAAWRLKRGAWSRGATLPPPTPTGAEPAPMSDLESALDSVADSSGRSLREEIDAQTDQVDQLRVPDDTGPLLRRALDSVTDDAESDADDPER